MLVRMEAACPQRTRIFLCILGSLSIGFALDLTCKLLDHFATWHLKRAFCAVSSATSDAECLNGRCNSLDAVLNEIRSLGGQGHSQIDVAVDPGIWQVPTRGQIGAAAFGAGAVEPAAVTVRMVCSSSLNFVANWTVAAFAPPPCIFSCAGGGAGLVTLVDLYLGGLQMQGCTATSPDMTINIAGSDVTASVGPLGGALFATMGAHVVLNRTAFVGNGALGVGGAIALASASLSVFDSYFMQNSAGSGGAIMASELQQSQFGFQIVQLSVSSIEVFGSWFVSNSAASVGGAVLLPAASIPTTSHILRESVFWGNSAASGGAIVCQSCQHVILSGVVFSANAASMLPDFSEGIGGAVLVDGALATVLIGKEGASFISNTASAAGGALALSGGCSMSSEVGAEVNFESNLALDGMGGAMILQDSTFTVLGKASCKQNQAGILGACALLSGSSLAVHGRFQTQGNTQVERSPPGGGFAQLVLPFASDSASRGGGSIAAVGSRLNLTFFVARDNSASKGGAILCLECDLLQISEAYFFQNSATDLGAELALIDSSGLIDISNFHMVGKARAWHQHVSGPSGSYISQDPPAFIQGGPSNAPDAADQISNSEKLWRSDVFPHSSDDWKNSPVDLDAGVNQFGGAIAIVGGSLQSKIVFRGQPAEDFVFTRKHPGQPKAAGRSGSITTSSISSYRVIGGASLESGFGGCVAVLGAPLVIFDHVMINGCQANSGAVIAVLESQVAVVGGMMTRGITSEALPSRASIFGGGIAVVVGASSVFNVTGSSMYAGRAALGAGLACYGGASVNIAQTSISMHFWERYRSRVCRHQRYPSRMLPCSGDYVSQHTFPAAAGFTTNTGNDDELFRGAIAGGFLLVGLPWSPGLSALANELPSSSCSMTLERSDMHNRFMDNGVGLVMVGNQSVLTLKSVQYYGASTSVGSLALVRGGTLHADDVFACDVHAYDRQLYTGGFHAEMGATMHLNNILWTPFPLGLRTSEYSQQERHAGLHDTTFGGGGALFTVSPRVFDLPGQYFFDEYPEVVNAPVNRVEASNLFIEGVSTYYAGAAIYIEGRALVSIVNLTVHTAVSQGAAAAVMIGGDPVDFSGKSNFPPLEVHMENIDIVNTTAEANSGGAIAIYHPAANVTILNIHMSGCTLVGSGGGGCIAVADRATLVMRNVMMVDPWVYGFGGAALLVESGATVAGHNFKVTGAIAWNAGVGGAVIVTEPQTTFVCDGCSFSRSSSLGSHGGAMLVNSGAFSTLTASDFRSSAAGQNGGAIMLTDARSVMELNNVSFHTTHASGVGGAIAVAGGALLVARGISLRSTSAANAGGGLNLQNSRTVLADSSFFETFTTSATGGGGGLACSNCQLQLNSIAFTSSQSASGGDMLVSGLNALVQGTAVTSTSSTSAGGGGSMATRSGAQVQLNHSSISSASSRSGGAFSILQASRVQLGGHSIFTGCRATADGGSISLSGAGSQLSLTGTTEITHSQATTGGAVSVSSRGTTHLVDAALIIVETSSVESAGGIDLAQSIFTLTNSSIIIKQASASGSGGAIRCLGGSTLSIDHKSSLDIHSCSAETGGGIQATGSGTTISAQISDQSKSSITFTNCSASHSGAGLVVSEAALVDLRGSRVAFLLGSILQTAGQGAGMHLTSAAVVKMSDVEGISNQLSGGSGSGAAIYVLDSKLTITGVLTLANNHALTQKLLCGAGVAATSSKVDLSIVVSTNNSCPLGYGGTFAFSASTVVLRGQPLDSAAVSSMSRSSAAQGATIWLDDRSSFHLESKLSVSSAGGIGSLLFCRGGSHIGLGGGLDFQSSKGYLSDSTAALDVQECAVDISGSVRLLGQPGFLVRGMRLRNARVSILPSGSLVVHGFGAPMLKQGGGMHLSEKSILSVAFNSSLLLEDNLAALGGGLYMDTQSAFVAGSSMHRDTFVVNDDFRCNHSSLVHDSTVQPLVQILNNRGEQGAGLFAGGGSFLCLSSATVENNTAEASAGAIDLEGIDPSSYLHMVQIRGNTAGCSQAGLVCRASATGRCGVQSLWLYASVIDGNFAPQTVRRDLSCGSAIGASTQCQIFEVDTAAVRLNGAFSECLSHQNGQVDLAPEVHPRCTSIDEAERSWYIAPAGSNSSCCGAQSSPCGSLTSTFLTSSLQTGDALVFSGGTHRVADPPIVVTGGDLLDVEGARASRAGTASTTVVSTGPESLFSVSTGADSAASVLTIANISIKISLQQFSPVISCIGTAANPAQVRISHVSFSPLGSSLPRAPAIFASNCILNLHNVTITGLGDTGIVLSSSSTRLVANGLNITAGISGTGGSGIRISQQAFAHIHNATFAKLAVATGQNGGAIHCSESGAFFCSSCNFSLNGAGTQAGGDIYSYQCAIKVSNSSSQGGQAIQGAHAYLGLGSSYEGFKLDVSDMSAGLGESGTGGAFHVEDKSSLEWTHSIAAACQSGDRGGVVFAADSAVTLKHVQMLHSNSTNDGGCVALTAASSLVSESVSFQACSAQNLGQGGSLFLFQESAASLSMNSFIGCSAASGGCVSSTSSSLTAISTRFDSGFASSHGGCILVEAGEEMVLPRSFIGVNTTLQNCTSQTGSGGGLAVVGMLSTLLPELSVSLQGIEASECRAPQGSGGGVSLTGHIRAELTKQGDKFSALKHCASNMGGGLAVSGDARLSVSHAKFHSNTAVNRGGAMTSDAISVQITGSEFSNNSVTFAAAGDFPSLHAFGGASVYLTHSTEQIAVLHSSTFFEAQTSIIVHSRPNSDCLDVLTCTQAFMDDLHNSICPALDLRDTRCTRAATNFSSSVAPATLVGDFYLGSNTFGTLSAAESAESSPYPVMLAWSGAEPQGIGTNSMCTGDCHVKLSGLALLSGLKHLAEFAAEGSVQPVCQTTSTACPLGANLPAIHGVAGMPLQYHAVLQEVESNVFVSSAPGAALPGFFVWPVDAYGAIAGSALPPTGSSARIIVQAEGFNAGSVNHTWDRSQVVYFAELTAAAQLAAAAGLPALVQAAARPESGMKTEWRSYGVWQFFNSTAIVPETPDSVWRLKVAGELLPLPVARFSSCQAGRAPTFTFPGQASEGAQCQACLSGTYSPSGKLCEPCPAGQFTSQSGAASCEPCAPGTHQPTIGTPCVPCADGFYSVQFGQTACIECPKAGVSCISGTIELLSGFYFVGVAAAQPRLNTSQLGPLIFPSAASAKTERIVLDLNSSLVTQDTQVFGCLSQFGCVASRSTVVCAEGHEGIACGSCRAGYVPSGSSCSKCFPAAVSWLMLLGLVTACLVIVSAAAVRQTFSDTAPFKIAIRMGLNHIQILTLTGMLRARGTLLFRQWFALIESVTGLGIASPFAAIRCLFQATAFTEFIAAMSFPVGLCMVAALSGSIAAYSSARARSRCQETCKYLSQGRFGSTWVFIGFISYAVVTMSVLNAMRCTDAPILGSRWLINDMQVPCFQGGHIAVVTVASVVGLVFCLGFPLLTAVILSRGSAQLKKKGSALTQRFGFLVSGLKVDRAYYESVVMLRKLLLSCIILVVNPVYQAVIGMLLMFASLNLQLYWSPYSRPVFNYLELGSLWCIIITLILSLSYLEEEQSEADLQSNPDYVSDAESWSTGLLLTVNFAYIAALLAIIVRLFLQPKTGAARRRAKGNPSSASRSSPKLVAGPQIKASNSVLLSVKAKMPRRAAATAGNQQS